MTRCFVLDNSVVMRWCFDEPRIDYAEDILQYMGKSGRAVVPVLWRYEAASVLSKAQRLGSIPPDKVSSFLDDLNAFSIATIMRE